VVAPKKVVAALVLVALAVGLTGCVRPARATEMGTVGDSFVVPVDTSDGEVRVEVSRLVEVSPAEADTWDLPGVAATSSARELPADPTFYFIYFSVQPVTGEVPPQSHDYWRLSTPDETMYSAQLMLPPDEAGCSGVPGDDGTGCVVVAVPGGTEIVMVRYYGVDRWNTRAGMGSEHWAGWNLE
jgi:hypothetical protein